MKNFLLPAVALLSLVLSGVCCRRQPPKPDPAAVAREHLRLAREAAAPAASDAEKAWAADSLDLDALDSAGVWDDYFRAWTALWRTGSGGDFDTRITAAAKKLLIRAAAQSPDKVKPLVRTLCGQLVASGDTDPAAAIAAWPYGLDLPGNTRSEIADRLLGAALLPGRRAPAIDGAGPMPSPPPTSTLVFFYESGCRTCGPVMKQLVDAWPRLVARGVRVITVSSDTDQQKFDRYAADTGMPWPDRLCDLQGFSGVNFRRYSVSSTPTLWVIDGKGILVDHYTTLDATGLID